VAGHTPHRTPKPLDAPALERLALHYVGRYATTRAKLGAYLARKVAERGWDGEEPPPIDALVERFASLAYVDDRNFATMRAAALARRGYGERRISAALKGAGIADADAEPARAEVRLGARAAAIAFARRKRIGPFAAAVPDRDQRRRLLGMMLRAGHSMEISRRIVESPPGSEPHED
jgi:regulatory protein